MTIHAEAHARAGLIGNPSDGYFGKTISLSVRNYAASVTCEPWPTLLIEPGEHDRVEFADVADLVGAVRRCGYYGGVRLVKAAVKRFADHCRDRGLDITGRGFRIRYETDIPVRVGLAGSSAIVTATIKALMQLCDVDIPRQVLPNLVLAVETDELGIGAGLQDRVVQVYGGAVFMDFGRERMDSQGHGRYVPLDPGLLPPLFVAHHANLAEGTEVTHNDLRDRYDRGERRVIEAMEQFAGFAQSAYDLLVAGGGRGIGPLMDANFDLRASLCRIDEGNRQLVEIGRRLGASVKFAGSGGAVVGAYDGDPERLARLRRAYADFGAVLIVPEV